MRKTLLSLAIVTALAVPVTAHAALPDMHPAGSDGHDFAFTGSSVSTVKIDYKNAKDKFAGTVTSDFEDTEGVLESASDEAAVCVAGREIQVFKFRKHRADVLIGSDKASKDGSWSVDRKKVNGKYYASVGKSNTLLREYYGGIDYYVSCKADSSGKLEL